MASRNSCSGRSPWSPCPSFARLTARKPWNPDPCWAAGHTAADAPSSGASIRHSRRSDRGCLLETLLSVGLWFAVFAAKDAIIDRIAGFRMRFGSGARCASSRRPVTPQLPGRPSMGQLPGLRSHARQSWVVWTPSASTPSRWNRWRRLLRVAPAPTLAWRRCHGADPGELEAALGGTFANRHSAPRLRSARLA